MINETQSNKIKTPTQTTTQSSATSDFIEWLNSKHKDRLDRARNRHPFMTTIRTSADNKIISMYNNLTEISKPLSAFEEEKFKYTQPSFYHKLYYDIDKIYHRNKYIIDNIKLKSNLILTYFKEKKEKYLNLINKQFEHITTKESELKQTRVKELKLLDQSPNKDFFSKLYLKLNWNLKEKDRLSEIEGVNREIARKLTINRIQNYWRQVCSIKNNYVIEQHNTKNIIDAKNYETIFYKIFKISKAKIFGLSYSLKTEKNIKNKLIKLSKFLVICLYFTVINFRYNLYDKQTILEIEEEERQNDKIFILSEKKTNDGVKLVKIQNIYDEKTDKKCFELLKKEKIIKKKLENNLIEEKDLEDPLTADAFTAFMHYQESGYYFNIFKNTLLVSYLIYSIVYKNMIRKQITIKHSFYRFALYSLITNEIFQYLSLIVFDGSKNAIATKGFDNDQANIMRYIFYKNNVDKAYHIIE